MARINITEVDEWTGEPTVVGWFDSTKVTVFKEDTEWDGNNIVSAIPGCAPYGHQQLIRTAGGRWVLNSWSQWEGSPDVYEFIDDDRAREWLILNHKDEAVTKHFGQIEDERGPGRPEVGNAVHVRLGDLLPGLDAYAAEHGVNRAEAIRQAVRDLIGATV